MRHRFFIGEIEFVENVEQLAAVFVVQFGQIQNGRANDRAAAVIFPFEVVDRINLGHARHQDTAGQLATVAGTP